MFQDVIEGTRDFHHEMRISEGQFSDVYRAQMGNKTFAVKLFKQVIVDYDTLLTCSFSVKASASAVCVLFTDKPEICSKQKLRKHVHSCSWQQFHMFIRKLSLVMQEHIQSLSK